MNHHCCSIFRVATGSDKSWRVLFRKISYCFRPTITIGWRCKIATTKIMQTTPINKFHRSVLFKNCHNSKQSQLRKLLFRIKFYYSLQRHASLPFCTHMPNYVHSSQIDNKLGLSAAVVQWDASHLMLLIRRSFMLHFCAIPASMAMLWLTARCFHHQLIGIT